MSEQTTESIILAGGCFWCLDAAYQEVNGVIKVTSGYAGGAKSNPSYAEVCSGATGHAEVVKVEYDPEIISLDTILDIFFVLHDPTTLNRQGNDVGTQYRSAIFYANDEQQTAAEQAINRNRQNWDNPIVTEITAFDKFYKAEEDHQDYYRKNPEAGYCQVVISPKLAKLRQKFATLLKASTN
jgi:peptide-methionine (S)-S-oxide reductase